MWTFIIILVPIYPESMGYLNVLPARLCFYQTGSA